MKQQVINYHPILKTRTLRPGRCHPPKVAQVDVERIKVSTRDPGFSRKRPKGLKANRSQELLTFDEISLLNSHIIGTGLAGQDP